MNSHRRSPILRSIAALVFFLSGSVQLFAEPENRSLTAEIEDDRSRAGCAYAQNKPRTGIDLFKQIARCNALSQGVPPEIAVTVMEIESAFNPRARGADGEVGLMQVMPPTARLLGFQGTLEQLSDPDTNIRLGVTYLAEAYRLARGDLCTTVMKYRAGHAETRFSVRSVNYCERARSILTRDGYAVSGIVPKATFGFASARSGGGTVGGGCARRSFAPGPGYGRCIVRTTGASDRQLATQRRRLFQ